MLHAAVRLGRADAAGRRPRPAWPTQVDGPFAPLAARHADAAVGGDVDALAAVAAGFEAVGADLVAAEA